MCILWFHHWSKWTTESFRIYKDGTKIVQYRRCTRCERVQVKDEFGEVCRPLILHGITADDYSYRAGEGWQPLPHMINLEG